MGSKITEDEITSIIKERIDNFELKNDIPPEERLSIEAINEMLHDLTEFGMAAGYITSINNGKGFCIKSIPIIGFGELPYGFESAIRAATIDDPIEILCGTEHQIIEAIREQVGFRNEFEILNRYDIEKPMLLESKENHPYGWYRKFEKKRF